MPLRLGLCCAFQEQPIAFRNTTVAATSKLSAELARQKLAALCQANAQALAAAIEFCGTSGIGCFRVVSQILPLKTHPKLGYDLADLPGGEATIEQFRRCGRLAKKLGVRTCFHPDQFVVLNSPRPEVVTASLAELEYQAEVADWIGADVVNIHGGGVFGDKTVALARFAKNLGRLSDRARSKLTVENDDKLFTPADLLSICLQTGIPLVYDVHHHRCHPDGLSVEEATAEARATWNREPLFHISSPAGGWQAPRPEIHAELINVADFPPSWLGQDLTVEIEARGKEVAVRQLAGDLAKLAKPKARRRSARSC
ncbi:MAG: UV DNA damage repair endonuclease UvsE [Pirellulaceae bacterium]|nr:UV DNA damage repair endonuclease UvsE [Pirellulaceae bacterium]